MKKNLKEEGETKYIFKPLMLEQRRSQRSFGGKMNAEPQDELEGPSQAREARNFIMQSKVARLVEKVGRKTGKRQVPL